MSRRWDPDDAWQAHRDALRHLYGTIATRPTVLVSPLSAEQWADGRPDHLAPFWCPCGGVFHVRRHLEDHVCEAQQENQAA